jgi:hypothetical protein
VTDTDREPDFDVVEHGFDGDDDRDETRVELVEVFRVLVDVFTVLAHFVEDLRVMEAFVALFDEVFPVEVTHLATPLSLALLKPYEYPIVYLFLP